MAVVSTDLPQTEEQEVIPLTIVTGFLGSGKTTLINNLLQLLINENKKVAIIQNEFGDSSNGVEDAFMSGSDGAIFTNVVELANGCVCCSVRDNFALAVEQLASQKKYNYILLECSGMADPAKIISMFWIDQDLESSIYLDGVLSVVDGKYLTAYLKDTDDERVNDKQSLQIIHQIAYADKILINKKDLIQNQTDLDKLQSLIHSINNVGQILITERSKIDKLSEVLYIRAYDIIKPPNFDMLLKQNNIIIDKEVENKENEDMNHMICAHDGNIKSFNMECVEKCVDLDKVNDWLSELLWNDQYQYQETNDAENKSNDNDNSNDNKMDIYRMKAVLPTKDGSNHYLSAVQDLYEIEEGNTKWIDVDNNNNKQACLCKMVVIGKYLNEQILQLGFDSIFV